jgi:hypothetical protein
LIVAAIFTLSTIVSESIYADDGLPNTPVRTKEQAKNIDISCEMLYWFTDETVDWAFVLSGNNHLLNDYFKTFAFNGAFGFRVGLGYNFIQDEWDTKINYTWFHSKANDHTEGGEVNSAFLATRFSALEPFTSSTADINLHYNIFDWDLGRSFLTSRHLILRPSVGIKGGWIIQKINSYCPTTAENGMLAEKLKQTFAGGGPKGGILAKWCFSNIETNYFSLIGQLEAGYLWGHWSIQDKCTYHTLYVVPRTINLNTTTRNFGSLVLHSFMGLGWDCNFSNDDNHFAIKLGYELEDWFNQLQIFTDSSGSQNNDLILQGLNLSLNFNF